MFLEKKMKIKEIVAKKDADLTKELAVLKNQLTKVRFEVASKETNKHTEIAKIKKDIARIQTILREREIERMEAKDEKKA
jgi:large subunit ribosomal protein L29